MSLIDKVRIKQYILLILAEIIAGFIITGFAIIFQLETTFESVMDALMIAGIVIGGIGWILLLSCIGVYETIEFCVMFLVSKIKREEFTLSFYEVVYLRDKTDAIAHRTMMLTSFLFLIAGSIMYYIYYTQMIV